MSNALQDIKSFTVAGFLVDPRSLRVTRGDDEFRLEARPMQVLTYLAQHQGQVVSRDELQDELWPNLVVTEDAVTNSIAKVRRVFGDDPRQPEIIETIPKVGYRLIAKVSPLDLDEQADDYRQGAQEVSQAIVSTTVRTLAPHKWYLMVAAVLLLSALLVTLGVSIWGSGKISRTQLKDVPTLAILPFRNISSSPEYDYYASGIAADLMTQLSRVSGLTVQARSLVTGYMGKDIRPKQIFSEIGADYIVSGSVQRLETRVRINVQLVDARVERILWGDKYEGEANKIFEIQDQLASSVLAALSVQLAPGEKAILATRATDSVKAYEHYLKGLERHGRRTREQNQLAKKSFQNAIGLDSKFAKAYTGLALAYSREAIDGWTSDPIRSLELAKKSVERAAALDPTLPQVHFVKGQVELFRRRHKEAIAAVQRAIQINKGYADAYALQAWILNYAGRPKPALEAMKLATRFNPKPTASYLEVLGEIQFANGNYRQASDTFQKVLDINPSYVRARMWNATSLANAGDIVSAQWEANELRVLEPNISLAGLAFSFPFKDPRQLDLVFQGLKRAGIRD